MERQATCVCEQLTITVTGEPVRVNMCNCSDCQRRSGSAFQIGAYFPDDKVISIAGNSKTYKRPSADGERTVDLYFCPDCGVSVYFRAEELRPGWTGIHGGCFADPDFPAPTHVLFTERKYKWVELPSADHVTAASSD